MIENISKEENRIKREKNDKVDGNFLTEFSIKIYSFEASLLVM